MIVVMIDDKIMYKNIFKKRTVKKVKTINTLSHEIDIMYLQNMFDS